MEHASIIFVALLFLAFGLVSKRLSTTIITPPMLFVAAGFLFSTPIIDLIHFELNQHLLKLLLEITLVLVLFSDAAQINLQKLKKDHLIPQRMLLIGMPLTIILGTAFASILPLGLTLCEAALLAAILTPTDAALGQVVVSSKSVPENIRIGLNVESGLNDGIALPIILVLASIASALMTNDNEQWFQFGLLQVTLGPLTGFVVAYVGAKLINVASDRGWISGSGEGLIALSIAALCFVLAETVHGNGFIAAFVGGLVFGHNHCSGCKSLLEFAETEGQLFTLGTFFIFGALLLPMALQEFNLWYWLFAVFALTIMRMLPVLLSLRGLKLNLPTGLFLGWFGPRGLASILFVSLVVGETLLPHPEIITHIVFITVLISVFAHGMTATPLAHRYGNSQAAIVVKQTG